MFPLQWSSESLSSILKRNRTSSPTTHRGTLDPALRPAVWFKTPALAGRLGG